MNIFKLLSNLYTNKKADWIKEVNDEEIKPFLIQRWLCMNDRLRVQTRWLDKYVFVLSPKMYLSLAWSVIPKLQKSPFVKYIGKAEEDTTYDFILNKVRKHMNLSDNDFDKNKERIIKAIEKDKVNWFSFYGVPKKYWKLHYIDFNLIKNFGPKKPKAQKGLEAWGM
jgi:hypothetical protein